MTLSGVYRLEDVDITDVSPTASEDLKQEEGTSLNSVVEFSLARDTRDNIFEPTRGSRNSLEFMFAGLGGDTQFYKVIAESAWFVPLPVLQPGVGGARALPGSPRAGAARRCRSSSGSSSAAPPRCAASGRAPWPRRTARAR